MTKCRLHSGKLPHADVQADREHQVMPRHLELRKKNQFLVQALGQHPALRAADNFNGGLSAGTGPAGCTLWIGNAIICPCTAAASLFLSIRSCLVRLDPWRRNPSRAGLEISRQRLARHRPAERWPGVRVVT